MIEEILRLFNAVHVEDLLNIEGFDPKVLSKTMRAGYILHPDISFSKKLNDIIIDTLPISAEKANASFHKSWGVVANSPIETLVIQQLVHYVTTYGFDELGVFDNSTVFVPKETLNIPSLKVDFNFVYISAISYGEIVDGIKRLGGGVALSSQTLSDIFIVIKGLEINYDEIINDIRNRELLAMLYEYYDIVPSDPESFLRYVIYRLTGETLVIKNTKLIEKLKSSDSYALDGLMEKAPQEISSIFLRYKALFLAMKSASNNKSFFNRLRKNAIWNHIPKPKNVLLSVTGDIKNGTFKHGELVSALRNANVFQKIRLLNALDAMLSEQVDSSVYLVRNGRAWITDRKVSEFDESVADKAFSDVYYSLLKDVSPNCEGMTFYIPENIHYALPSSEKQFLGNIPANSWVSVGGDLIVGVHWFDNDDERVDLDLSLVAIGEKYGWDGSWRRSGILFSGDLTYAPKPNGATELFYIPKSSGIGEAKLINLNHFNRGDGEKVVDCRLLVASEKVGKFESGYMVDPNNIFLSANIPVNSKQSIIGLITEVSGEFRVYFSPMSYGNSITSRVDDLTRKAHSFFVNKSMNSLELAELIVLAGGNVVSERPSEDDDYVDLSPSALSKTTILGILSKND